MQCSGLFLAMPARTSLQKVLAIYRFRSLNRSIFHRSGPWIMPYALLADLVLILHATFILFVVFGGLLVFWRRHLIWLHIPAAAWGILIELRGWICPLTYLENDLRAASGDSGYAVGFIEHYLVPLVYPPALNHDIQILLGLAVLLVNTVIYALLWYKLRNKPDSLPH